MHLPTVSLRRGLTTLVVLVVVLGGFFWYLHKHDSGTHFSADFSGTVGLYPGNDVRELGVKVGKVTSVKAHGTDVVVGMQLDSGRSAAAGTGAVILSPSLVSDRYVQLTQLWTGGPKLAEHAVIPETMTATPVELDQLQSSLTKFAEALGPNGANKNGAFSDLLNTAAANLKGNGKQFNTTINQLSLASQTLANSSGDLFSTVTNLKTFTATLQASDTSVSSLNTQLAQVSAVLASDRQSFNAAINDLSGALGMVQTFIQNNRAALTQDVGQLASVTRSLAAEKASIAQALATAPQALQNVLNAYDPSSNTLDGRGDLNEISIWAGALHQVAPTTPAVAGTASTARPGSRVQNGAIAPPTLLPSSAGPSASSTGTVQ